MLFLTMLFSEQAKFIMTPKKHIHLASVKLGIPGSQNAQNLLAPVEKIFIQRKKNPKHEKLVAEHTLQKKRRIKKKELMELMEEYLEAIEREKKELEKHLKAEHRIYQDRIEEAEKIIELAILRKRQEEMAEYVKRMEAVMDAVERDNPGFRDREILDLEVVEKLWHGFHHALEGITVPFGIALKKLKLEPQAFAPITSYPNNKNTLSVPRVMFDQNQHPYTTMMFLTHNAQGVTCGIYDKHPSQHDVNIAYQQLVFASLFFPCANRLLIPKCEGNRAVQLWNTAIQFGLQPVWGEPPRLSLDQQRKLLVPPQQMKQLQESVRHHFTPDNPFDLHLKRIG